MMYYSHLQGSLLSIYKKIRGFVKRNKIIFSWYRHWTDKDYQQQLALMKKCSVKSELQIKTEMRIYKDYWRTPADDYVRYGLFNKTLSIEDILDYVPMQHYYCRYYDQQFSGVDRQYWDDKWNQYQLFKKVGIVTPEVVALVKNGMFVTLEGVRMELNELLCSIGENERLFIKPTNGNSGNGIIVLKKNNGMFFCKNAVIHSVDDLHLKKYLFYIVQRGLKQREDLAEINSSSLNTLRTIVQYNKSKSRIVAIILRIGRGYSEVDNSGQGGISLAVDVSNGRFSDFAGREHGGGIFYTHPDTGYKFQGKGINDWESISKKILNTVSKIDSFSVLGWDLAIGEDNNVYAIEFNMGFGIEHAQTIIGGFRRRMGIYPGIE